MSDPEASVTGPGPGADEDEVFSLYERLGIDPATVPMRDDVHVFLPPALPEPLQSPMEGEVQLGLFERCALTDVSLEVPPDFAPDEYAQLADVLARLEKATPFLIGDLVHAFEQKFGNVGTGIIADYFRDLAPSTLESYASVCHRVPRARRNSALTFAHHRLVSKLSAADQKKWLARAAKGRWSAAQLRHEMKGDEHDQRPSVRDAAERLWAASEPLEHGGEHGYWVREAVIDALLAALGTPRHPDIDGASHRDG